MDNKTNLLLTIALLVLVVLNLSIYMNKILTPTAQNEEIKKQYEANYAEVKKEQDEEEQRVKNNEMTTEEVEQAKLTDLKSMGEAERMYTYFADYITLVEGERYEEAYNLLYDDFKKQYFPTLNEFIFYIKSTYPKFIAVRYETIERQGDYYIIKVLIKDSIATEDVISLEQRFVLHEKNFNDYEISFQIIS